ncbi:plasmid pRiA4b ORF-3 family protein [Paeniglutamicibacter sp.]|uniref:plasmid pRiA4b ORF-3 family protein n=1 Tax=Paeniglutamicibacter sp. TaxID=1934391 RepID=UPI00398A1BCA
MKNLRTQHTLHIELHGSEPAIWRRIEVDGSMTLERFHEVLQGALGWTNSHLHLYMDSNPFIRGQVAAGEKPTTWLMAGSIEDGLEGEDEAGTTLTQALARSGGTLWYEYDLGDSWMHLITEESSRALDPEDPEARVLDGALRVPLEDSGGLGGWYEMLKLAQAASADPDRSYILDWFRAHFGYFTPVDPEAFDAGAANMRVRLLLGGMPEGTATGKWLSTLPVYGRLMLAEFLYAMGIDVFASPATTPMPEEAPRAMASILWWINACDGTGLPLTAAGYLSPSVLPEVIEGIGWEHEDFVQFGGKTEVHLHGILDFREMLMDIGLLKAQGKKLVATPAALRAAQDPAKLWAHLAKRARNSARDKVTYDATMLALMAASGAGDADRKTIEARTNEGMRLLEYVHRDGRRIEDKDFNRLGDRYVSITKAFRMAVLKNGNKGRAVGLERAFALAVLRS